MLTLPTTLDSFPVAAGIKQLSRALKSHNRAILIAPPGAGKTTVIPLHLANEPWAEGQRILVLVPRRLAARGAGERMATLLGEQVGETVGYRVRFDTKISQKTRIELMTEGVFIRLIADDPLLDGVAAVLFDEYHERSLDADLGLALALESQEALRADLKLLVMSATLESAAIAAFLGDCPVIETRGRAFPVETHYRDRQGHQALEPHLRRITHEALAAHDGNALVFLPGRRDVERFVDDLRSSRHGPAAQAQVVALHGGLDSKDQAALLCPPEPGCRRVTVATSIAQSSLTLPGITLVIDAGLARRPHFDLATGLTHLETVRVSRASADQRRGRAGRTAPGVCYRLWGERQTKALDPHDRPEIMDADLAPLTLTLAQIGISDMSSLAWLNEPPKPAQEAAASLLKSLQLIDESGRITRQGQAAARLPLHPRLAHMIAKAADFGSEKTAAELAALLAEPSLGGRSLDLEHRLADFQKAASGRVKTARAEARKWAATAHIKGRREDGKRTTGALAALAFPDRIAQQRTAREVGFEREKRFLLAGGSGALLDASHPLARETLLVALEVGGRSQGDGRIHLAAALSEDTLRQICGSHLIKERQTHLNKPSGRAEAWQIERLGALELSRRKTPLQPGEAEALILDYLRAEGIQELAWDSTPNSLRQRLGFLHRKCGPPWPDMSDDALRQGVEIWLGPFLSAITQLSDLTTKRLDEALITQVPYERQQDLAQLAPAHYEAPSGRKLRIDYRAEAGPTVHCRVQDVYGLSHHPTILAGREPLVFALLSPAMRPFQTTRDLVGFWRGSWRDARKEMKSRYPKHDWPEDPEAACAQRRS